MGTKKIKNPVLAAFNTNISTLKNRGREHWAEMRGIAQDSRTLYVDIAEYILAMDIDLSDQERAFLNMRGIEPKKKERTLLECLIGRYQQFQFLTYKNNTVTIPKGRIRSIIGDEQSIDEFLSSLNESTKSIFNIKTSGQNSKIIKLHLDFSYVTTKGYPMKE